MSTVILSGSEHCPEAAIARAMEESGMNVVRLDTRSLGHDADAIATLFLEAAAHVEGA